MGKVFFGATFTLHQTDKEYSSRIRKTQACKNRPGRVEGRGLPMRLFRGKEEGKRSVIIRFRGSCNISPKYDTRPYSVDIY